MTWLLPLFLVACSSSPPSYEVNAKDVQMARIRLDQLGFEIELLGLKGGVHCMPARMQRMTTQHRLAGSELLTGMVDDAMINMDKLAVELKQSDNLLHQLLKKTYCGHTENAFAESELQQKLLLLMSLDNQFPSASARLLPEYQRALASAAKILISHPHWTLSLVGHTDNQGSSASNLKLGQQRAEAVRDVLVKHGVSEGQISITSQGEMQPVTINADSIGRLANRRVDAYLLIHPDRDRPIRTYSLKDWYHAPER
ncbi:OmpA family protein [Vibrio stylophorae]|uniref:OmpA family protein n=1 Tax=Vibrio stylophorae TaxID=659351 RepID=UPI001F2EDC5D|nr:OmpA family protein [Vibrio stylophorae]